MKPQQRVYLTHPKMPAFVHGILNLPRPSFLGGGVLGLFLLTWVFLGPQVVQAETIWSYAGPLTGDPIAITTFPDSDALDLAVTDFTMSACVLLKRTNGSSESAILSKRGSDNGWAFVIDGNNTDNIRTQAVKFVTAHNKSGSRVGSGQALSLNTTYHVAVVYNAGVAKLFINGINDGNKAIAPPGATRVPLYVGGDGYYSGLRWHGTLSNLQIDNTALSDAEIQTLSASCGGCTGSNCSKCTNPFDPSCGKQPPPPPEVPTYAPTTGEIYIPQLSISGSTQTCKVYLQQQPSSLNFLLDASRLTCQ